MSKQTTRQRRARLIIALAMATGGLVSVSLAYVGKWSGVREPVQISRSHTPAAAPANQILR